MQSKYLLLAILSLPSWILAQKPREVQVDNEPVDWYDPYSTTIIIIVSVLLILFVIWRFIKPRLKKRE